MGQLRAYNWQLIHITDSVLAINTFHAMWVTGNPRHEPETYSIVSTNNKWGRTIFENKKIINGMIQISFFDRKYYYTVTIEIMSEKETLYQFR